MMDYLTRSCGVNESSNCAVPASGRPGAKQVGDTRLSQELEKARAHVRATQWAFAHASMVVDCDEWDTEDGGDDDWDDDWGDESPATRDPSTPDWRGAYFVAI